jgi:hypothetical protein
MEVSGQLHDTAALPPGKELPVPIGYEAGWAPESVWLRWRRQKSCSAGDCQLFSPKHLLQTAVRIVFLERGMDFLEPIPCEATLGWERFEIILIFWFVCVYFVFVLYCVSSGLATGWSLVQGVLPIVCKCKITKPKRRPRPDMGWRAIE